MMRDAGYFAMLAAVCPALDIDKDIRRRVVRVHCRSADRTRWAAAECSYHETLGGPETAAIVAIEMMLGRPEIEESDLSVRHVPAPIKYGRY